MTALQTSVLDLVAARDFAFAGGKAVNLAELLGAGFPVPDGFCVGTPAYAQAAAAAGLDAVLAAGTDLAAGARAALLAIPMPADVAEAVTDAYTALGDRVPVAVRSSATAEDLPGGELRGPTGHLPQRGRRRRGAGRRTAVLGVAVDGPRRGLPRRRGHPRTRAPSSRWWCSGWSTRRSRACCSRPTRSAATAAAACSTPRAGWATPSSRVPSTPITGWSTGA